MELRQLRYFVAVAEERHFGRAADRLRIAQPAISQQIKSFERSIGAKLFIRARSGVQLTEAGDALLDHARLVLELAGRAMEIPRLVTDGKVGTLKVGTDALNVYPVANDVIRAFHDRFPHIELQLFPDLGSRQLEAIERRKLDVAFVHAPFDQTKDFQYLALGRLEIRIALPEHHHLASLERIPLVALLDEPFVTMSRTVDPSLTAHIDQHLFGPDGHPMPVEVADATEGTRLHLVAEERGFTLILRPEATELRIPGVTYRSVADDIPDVEYGLVWVDTGTASFISSFVSVSADVIGSSAQDDPS